jgi:hypothetical protein
MDFVKNFLTGGKAILGSLVAGIVSWLLMALVAVIAGMGFAELMTARPILMLVLLLLLLVINIFILGFVYNKFWDWD